MNHWLAGLILVLAIALRSDAARADADVPAGARIVMVSYFRELLDPWREAAIEFKKQTGIEVVVQSAPYQGWETWVRTMFLGRMMPEVIVVEGGMADDLGRRGLVLKLNGELDQPNPFDAGQPWREAFLPSALEEARDAIGDCYATPYSLYGIGVFYNRTQFEQAGVRPPATFAEWMDVSAKLKQSGFTPMMIGVRPTDAQSVWLAQAILEAFLRVHVGEVNLVHDSGWTFDPTNRSGPARERIDLTERWIAFEKGTIDPARAPEFAETARMLKAFSAYWHPDFLSISGWQEVSSRFARAETSQMLAGTWFVLEFQKLQEALRVAAPGRVADWGVFRVPPIGAHPLLRAGDVADLAGVRTRMMVTRQAEPWRERAGIRWLQFLTSRGVAQDVWRHSAIGDLPAMRDVRPNGNVAALTPRPGATAFRIAEFDGYDELGVHEFWSHWQEYLGDHIDLPTFLQRLSASQRGSLVRLMRMMPDRVDQALIERELPMGGSAR